MDLQYKKYNAIWACQKLQFSLGYRNIGMVESQKKKSFQFPNTNIILLLTLQMAEPVEEFALSVEKSEISLTLSKTSTQINDQVEEELV